MPDDFEIPHSLNVMLCTFARWRDGLTVVNGALQSLIPGETWFVAGYCDCTAEEMARHPSRISILRGEDPVWVKEVRVDLSSAEEGVLRLPMALELPAVLDEAAAGLYLVHVEMGGMDAKLPIIVPTYSSMSDEVEPLGETS